MKTIEFQQFAARVIFLTANLENAFLGVGTPTGQTHEIDVQKLLREISTAVGTAYQRSRSRMSAIRSLEPRLQSSIHSQTSKEGLPEQKILLVYRATGIALISNL